jgi:hypothetical protein
MIQSFSSVLLLTFLSAGCTSIEAGSPVFSTGIGTQTIGVRYQFTDECALVETAKEIQKLGCDTLKIAITKKYDDDYKIERDSRITSVLDLVQRKESFKQVMDMPFRNIMMWVYPFSDKQSGFYKGYIPTEEAEATYQEIFDFTAYLLKTYSGSGKTFFIGNWEGDWHLLRENYNYDLDPAPEAIEGAIEWFNLRQQAISDAIKQTPHHEVEIYYYVELNHVRKSLEDERPTLVNSVLPHIKTDFVSWSSYDITTEAAKKGGAIGKQRVFDALDYIEKHLPPSDIEGKRVFVGEYGFHLQQVADEDEQRTCALRVMQWALEWGCPFVLYWELYCNEQHTDTGEHRGFWLIDDKGIKQPAWHLHHKFLHKANRELARFHDKYNKVPNQASYNRLAVDWLEQLKKRDVK